MTALKTLLTGADDIIEIILGFATSIFEWALTNPIYALAIIMILIGMAVGLIKKFSHN